VILGFLTQLDDVANSAFTQDQVMNRFMIDEEVKNLNDL